MACDANNLDIAAILAHGHFLPAIMLDVEAALGALVRSGDVPRSDVPLCVRIGGGEHAFTFRAFNMTLCFYAGATLGSGADSTVYEADLVDVLSDAPESAEPPLPPTYGRPASAANAPGEVKRDIQPLPPLCIRAGGARGTASWRLAHRLPEHPNVLRPLAFGEDGRSMLMIRYPCDLFEAMWAEEAEGTPIPRFEPLAMAIDVLEAVIHLHDNGVAHRDVKPENVLVSRNGRGVLADLEYCTRASRLPLSSYAGTSRYTPPEILDVWGVNDEEGVRRSGADSFSPFVVDRYATAVTVVDILARDVIWTNATFEGIRSDDLERPLRQVEERFSPRVRLALQRLFSSLSSAAMDELLDTMIYEQQVTRSARPVVRN